ncbi:MAG: hypothetical protein K6E59_04485, partial [Bacilli bacterium]|nr:hypothetical protein [Bacilli bacterium]
MLSFNTRNDEELLHSSRMGDFAAEQELTERYFRGRFSACKLACPDAMSQLDDWELNDAHFHAFVQAVTSYRFQGVHLFTYYIDVLRNELFDALERKSKERAAMTFYDFDAPMLDGKGNEFTLSDS